MSEDGAGTRAMDLGLVERKGISHAFSPFRNKYIEVRTKTELGLGWAYRNAQNSWH